MVFLEQLEQLVSTLFFLVNVSFFGALFVITGNNVAREEALDALVSDPMVKVELMDSDFWAFLPTEEEKNNASAAIVFYPGAFVDVRAYAPICRSIAQQGYAAFLPSFLFNLAVTDVNAANRIMERNYDRNITTWSVGGHSLGAAAASLFVNNFENNVVASGQVQGLFMLGGTGTNNLSQRTDLSVLLLRGSLDILFPESDAESALRLLPPSSSTRYAVIEGGNHAQMGSYGVQFNDKSATISREEQQAIVVQELVQHLEGLTL